MIIPLINNIYDYDGKNVIVYQQDIFSKVYLRSLPPTIETNSEYFTENWWKFMMKAKFKEKLQKLLKAY